MKRSAILVFAFAITVSACAQRTGARAGVAVRSAPVAHTAPVFRSGFAPAMAFHGAARPVFRNPRPIPSAPPRFAQPPLRYVTIGPPPATRFYQKNNTYRPTRRPHGFAIIGYPAGVVGFLPDTGFFDDSWNDLSYPSEPTALQLDYGYNEYPDYPDYGAEYAQYPQASESAPAEVLSTPATPENVTLIFNNGQPPEQIQNYLATRTTLTVIDGTRRRDIPIADLNVPATVKANRAAGIDFSLPAFTP